MHKLVKNIGILPFIQYDSEKGFVDITAFDSEGKCLDVPIDMFSSQDFMYNSEGWPINDIMLFEETQNDSVARAVLERIRVLHPENMPAGTSPEQLLKQIVPANYSTPAEYMKIQAAFAKDYYATLTNNLQKESEKAAAKPEEKSESKVD